MPAAASNFTSSTALNRGLYARRTGFVLTCFMVDKQDEQAKMTAGNEAAIGLLDSAELTSSERHIGRDTMTRAVDLLR